MFARDCLSESQSCKYFSHQENLPLGTRKATLKHWRFQRALIQRSRRRWPIGWACTRWPRSQGTGGQSGSSRSPTWRATLWPRARPTRSTSTATAIGSSGQKRRRTLEDSNFARKAKTYSLLNILIVMTNTSHRQNWAPYWLYYLGLLERKVVRCLGRVSPGLAFRKKN